MILLSPTRLLIAFCVGVFASFSLPETSRFVPLIGLFFSIFLMILGRNRANFFQAACVLFCLLIGLNYAIERTKIQLNHHYPISTEKPKSQELNMIVRELPQISDTHTRFIGEAKTSDGKIYRLIFQDYLLRDWQVGSEWRISATVRAVSGTANFVGQNREAWALANQIDGSASIGKKRFRLPKNDFSLENGREKIRQNWQLAAQNYPRGVGLMTALAIGDNSGLDAKTWAALRPLGLNHLVSISGLHIGMVGALAAMLARLLMLFSPVVPMRPKAWALAIGVAAAAIYTGLAGFHIPALRSLLMLAIFAYAWTSRVNWGAWRTYWTAMTVVVLWQPTAVLAIGFWLSFGLVGTLIWTNSGRLPTQKWRVAVRSQAAASVVSSLATAYFFGGLPIFAPIANAFAIPIFTFLLVPLALLASVLPIDALKTAAAFLGEYVVLALQFLGEFLPNIVLPHSPFGLFVLAVSGSLFLFLPTGIRFKPLFLLMIIPFFIYRPNTFSGSLNVVVFDVGQGLSVLFQTQTQNYLFDTATNFAAEQIVLPNLQAIGINQLDKFILSHHDDDHDGGFSIIQNNIKIKELLAGQPEFYWGSKHCTDGENWIIDGVFFEWLTPTPNAKNDNDKSCVLRVIADDAALLITGDLGKSGEHKLVEKYGDVLRSNVLILGHHGSQYSNSGELLNAVAPEFAVASSGLANRFGHPSAQTLARLSANKIKLLRTDTQGAIQIQFRPNNFQAAALNQNKFWWQKKPIIQ